MKFSCHCRSKEKEEKKKSKRAEKKERPKAERKEKEQWTEVRAGGVVITLFCKVFHYQQGLRSFDRDSSWKHLLILFLALSSFSSGFSGI